MASSTLLSDVDSERQPSASSSMIDAVLVINLEHRLDRWNEVSEHLAQHLPESKIHRMNAVYGKKLPAYESAKWFRRSKRPATWAGRAGCTASHRNAFRLIAENQWEWTLVLEDDVQIVAPLASLLSNSLANFLDSQGSTFQFVYLGWNAPNMPVQKLTSLDATHSIYQIDGALTTHAYIIHRDLAGRLLSQFPTDDADWWDWIARNLVIDKWYCRHLKSCTSIAAVSPPLAIQSESLSDITLREGSTETQIGSVDLLESLAQKTMAESTLRALWRKRGNGYRSTLERLKAYKRLFLGFS